MLNGSALSQTIQNRPEESSAHIVPKLNKWHPVIKGTSPTPFRASTIGCRLFRCRLFKWGSSTRAIHDAETGLLSLLVANQEHDHVGNNEQARQERNGLDCPVNPRRNVEDAHEDEAQYALTNEKKAPIDGLGAECSEEVRANHYSRDYRGREHGNAQPR